LYEHDGDKGNLFEAEKRLWTLRQPPPEKQKSPRSKCGGNLLADQGSNLDSSEPKPDVLPVTPSASVKPDKNTIRFILGRQK
jgi:hypothetical protein